MQFMMYCWTCDENVLATHSSDGSWEQWVCAFCGRILDCGPVDNDDDDDDDDECRLLM